MPQTPDEVEYEDQLARADNQCHDSDKGIESVSRCRNKRHLADLIITAWDAHQSKIVHWEEDRVCPKEGDPEVKLTKFFVEHPPGDLRIPVIDRPKDDEDRRNAHYHMEMSNNEHGVRKRNIDNNIA